MKKLITTMIAVMVMAFSVVPAFAVSSPVATSPAGGGGKSSDSPKTGSSDILAYTLLAASCWLLLLPAAVLLPLLSLSLQRKNNQL